MPIVLAIKHAERSLLPVEENGLTRTQLAKHRLRKRYQGAELLFNDGTIRSVQGVRFGNFTDSFLPFPFKWISLTGTRKVDLILGDSQIADIPSVRDIVIQYLKAEDHLEDWKVEGETDQEFLNCVSTAKSIEELFEALHLDSGAPGLEGLS